ncbi:MAG: N-acetyltransferase [Frankiales bacterium]|nr:N-acetyltransferase [Frankiales bacterium]
MSELRTARLLLRRWREEDREPWAALCADPVVMEHFPAPLTREQADAMADRVEMHFAEHGYGLWAVDVDGRFAGYTGLVWTDALGGRDLEVGWRLATWAWGRGYATEAAQAAVAVGLDNSSEVVSFTAVTNERSQRVMERIGMRRDGEFDHPRIPDSHRLTRHVLYRIP